MFSHSKKHRTFSEVCKDMIADTVRLHFRLKHVGYSEEKCQSVCFNCGESWGFSLLNKGTQYPLIFKAIFGYLNLNSLSWIVQPFTYEEIDLGFSHVHVSVTTQKKAGHGIRNTKINESPSSCS